MTPEERETLATMADEESMLASAARDGGPTQLRRLARCAALRAALAPPPTCGTCRYFVARTAAPAGRGVCQVFDDGRAPDDGCIKGYAPTETPR